MLIILNHNRLINSQGFLQGMDNMLTTTLSLVNYSHGLYTLGHRSEASLSENI